MHMQECRYTSNKLVLANNYCIKRVKIPEYHFKSPGVAPFFAVAFLLSERSSHTTGQMIHVDGGYVHVDRVVPEQTGCNLPYDKNQKSLPVRPEWNYD